MLILATNAAMLTFLLILVQYVLASSSTIPDHLLYDTSLLPLSSKLLAFTIHVIKVSSTIQQMDDQLPDLHMKMADTDKIMHYTHNLKQSTLKFISLEQ